MIRWGGISLVGGALAFLVVFSYLAATFNYPEVLDGPASFTWLRAPHRARYMPWLGVGAGAVGLIAMFRNVTTLVAPIAALNNYLLPLFMIILGAALLRWRASPVPSSEIS